MRHPKREKSVLICFPVFSPGADGRGGSSGPLSKERTLTSPVATPWLVRFLFNQGTISQNIFSVVRVDIFKPPVTLIKMLN